MRVSVGHHRNLHGGYYCASGHWALRPLKSVTNAGWAGPRVAYDTTILYEVIDINSFATSLISPSQWRETHRTQSVCLLITAHLRLGLRVRASAFTAPPSPDRGRPRVSTRRSNNRRRSVRKYIFVCGFNGSWNALGRRNSKGSTGFFRPSSPV